MQIVLFLVLLALLMVVTLGGVFFGSLLLGGVLAGSERARMVAPVFLVVVPAVVIGALVGGILIGRWAIRVNENLIVLGPLGGVVAGGAAGLCVGMTGASFWWRRLSRAGRHAERKEGLAQCRFLATASGFRGPGTRRWRYGARSSAAPAITRLCV